MIDRHRRHVVVERTIAASPAAIFAVLVDPDRHATVDGSGALRSVDPTRSARPLGPGSVFVTPMRRRPASRRKPDLVQAAVATMTGGRMRNTVVEYEQDRRIAWRNLGHHVWRWALTPDADPAVTHVAETFDWSTNRWPALIEWADFPRLNEAAMAGTLERLATLLEDTPGS